MTGMSFRRTLIPFSVQLSGSLSSRGERDRERERERERDRERMRERDRDVYPRSFHAMSSVADEPELLLRQNQDLRRRLEEESNNYKKRLETYKQAQQHQAALVSRLQAKILQYKQRCAGESYYLRLSHPAF